MFERFKQLLTDKTFVVRAGIAALTVTIVGSLWSDVLWVRLLGDVAFFSWMVGCIPLYRERSSSKMPIYYGILAANFILFFVNLPTVLLFLKLAVAAWLILPNDDDDDDGGLFDVEFDGDDFNPANLEAAR
jgi:hypothetical protein